MNLSPKAKLGVVVGISLAVLFVVYLVMSISYSNNEIRLSNLVTAQVETRDANYDKTWKVISQQVQLTQKYAEDFKDVYKSMLQGRYGEQGSQAMWQWIKEQNPQLDASLYTKVQNTIEAQREQFFTEQKKLISYNKTHKDLRQTFPGSFFVGNRPDVEFNIITSEKTKQVAETGEENDVNLFAK
jgi:hypothetical protein